MTKKSIGPETLAELLDGASTPAARRALLSQLNQDPAALAALADAAAYLEAREDWAPAPADGPVAPDEGEAAEAIPFPKPKRRLVRPLWLTAAAAALLAALLLWRPSGNGGATARLVQAGVQEYQAMARAVAELDSATLRRFAPPVAVPDQVIREGALLRGGSQAPENAHILAAKREAIRAFDEALDLDPRQEDALAGMASIALVSGREEDMQRALNRLEAVSGLTSARPDLAEARLLLRFSLALRFDRRDAAEEALASLQTLYDRRPEDGGTAFNLGTALLELGRVAEAREAYRAYLQRRPDGVYAEIARERAGLRE